MDTSTISLLEDKLSNDILHIINNKLYNEYFLDHKMKYKNVLHDINTLDYKIRTLPNNNNQYIASIIMSGYATDKSYDCLMFAHMGYCLFEVDKDHLQEQSYMDIQKTINTDNLYESNLYQKVRSWFNPFIISSTQNNINNYELIYKPQVIIFPWFELVATLYTKYYLWSFNGAILSYPRFFHWFNKILNVLYTKIYSWVNQFNTSFTQNRIIHKHQITNMLHNSKIKTIYKNTI